ncbi:hypothetical protein ACFL6T_04660 [Candidatus Zixiibacteriota bacterium]
MRFRVSPILILLALIAAGCAAGGRSAPETTPAGHVHFYQLDKGDEVGFSNETDMSMTMDVPQLPIPQPIEVALSMTQRLVVDEVRDGMITGELVNEDFTMSGMGDMLSQVGMGDLGNMRMPVSMDQQGHSEMNISFDQEGMGGGMMNMPGGLNSFFVPWPGHPVPIGATWIDSISYDQSESPMDISGTMITEFTYLGLEAVEGAEDAVTAHKVRAVLTGSMSGTTEAAGADMNMSGTWSGETDYWFDQDDGLLLSAFVSMRTSMLIEMFAPMEMVIPMDMEMKSTIRRVR